MKNSGLASDILNCSQSCDFIKINKTSTKSSHRNSFRENGHVTFYPNDTPNDEDESRMNYGQSKAQSYHHLKCLFRFVTGPGGVVSHKVWNHLMKCYNGNRKKPNKPKVKVVAPSFNVVHQNIPGRRNDHNVGQFIDQVVKRFHPAILFLTEVDPAKVEKHIPDGYKLHKGSLRDHDNIRVCVLIKVTIPYEIEDLNLDVPTVVVKMAGWRFVGVYREWTFGGDPETKQRRDLELLRLKTLIKWWRTHSRGKMVLMGDFNFDPDEPVTQHQKSLHEIRGIMEDQITNRGWTQLVTEITRSQKGEEPACLDHVYTNQDDFIETLYRENVTASDHYAIGIKIRLQTPVFMANTFFCRNIKGIPEGEFERVFTTGRVYEIYQATDINEVLDIFEFKVVRALNIVAPMRRVTTRDHYAKWVTPQLAVKIKRRNAMRKRAEVSKKIEDWNVFKAYQKVLAKELREARLEDFKADTNVRDAKKRWKAVRKHAGLPSKVGDNHIELEVDGEKIDEPRAVACTLNTYFKEKVVNLRRDLNISVENSLSYTDEYLEGKEVGQFEFKQVSRTYVKSVIRSLANTGATGRDGISTEVLKKFRHVLTGPLSYIINLAIHHGRYPDKWQLGVITPLPKGGKKTEMKNWRPICINTAASKVLETVLNNQISTWMEESGLYSKTQHAYRKLRSVTTALIELDTIVKDQLNKGMTVAILTTDISAGFNLVSRDILVPKMSKFGFGEKSCKLLDDYLTGRRTQVKVKGILSPEVTLDTGVGEGSVLGPNFFSCGMTDVSVVTKRVQKKLTEHYNMNCFLTQIEYADDTTGIIACENERELQIAVDELLAGFGRFYSANGLKLNETKCHVLVIRPHMRYMTITCAGQEEVPSLRLLGLFIDNKLTYETHTKIVCGRLAAKLKHLDCLKNKTSFKTLKEVTTSLIHSSIEFCAEIYLRNPKNQSLIQKRLNSTMRMLLDKDWDYSVSEMLYTLRWLNVTNMWHWCCIRTLKRIMGAPQQTPHLWNILNLNTDPLRNVRYNSLKLNWRKLTRWARESYVFCAVQGYNVLGLHGRLFADYEDMRDQIKSSITVHYGNANVK